MLGQYEHLNSPTFVATPNCYPFLFHSIDFYVHTPIFLIWGLYVNIIIYHMFFGIWIILLRIFCEVYPVIYDI